jgi:predicted flap endonuclease-1-like 5' DNA nuclease
VTVDRVDAAAPRRPLQGAPQMKVFLEDGMAIDCGGYKAIDTGIVLTEDAKRKNVIGFVPQERVQFILPDDVLDERQRTDGTTEFVYVPDDERQQRIDELEAQVAEVEAERANAEARVAEVEAQVAELEAERAAETEPEDLTVIDGIGPKYAERLEAAGITTFEALRSATVAEVVEAADVSEGRAEDWIEATRKPGAAAAETATPGSEADPETEEESAASGGDREETEGEEAEATD